MPTPAPQDRRKRPAPRRPLGPTWLFVGVFALFILVNLLTIAIKQKPIDYSQFKLFLQQDRLSEVTVGKEEIHGTYRDASGALVGFTTTPINDPKLVEQLEAQKVPFTGEAENKWLTELVSWI